MAMHGPRGNGRRQMMSEINVTPLVDVMLVLLIIFMVTAPMMTQGVDVNLPETTARPLRQKEKPVIVTINSKGDIYLNKIKCDRALFQQQLGKMDSKAKENPIFLRADKEVPYGLVAQIMADIKTSGFDKLGMVTLPEEKR